MESNTSQPFWYVFCPTEGKAKQKHPTQQQALEAAKILIEWHPERCFEVLKCEATIRGKVEKIVEYTGNWEHDEIKFEGQIHDPVYRLDLLGEQPK